MISPTDRRLGPTPDSTIIIGHQHWAEHLAKALSQYTADGSNYKSVPPNVLGIVQWICQMKRARHLIRVGFRPNARSTRAFTIDLLHALHDRIQRGQLRSTYYWTGTDVTAVAATRQRLRLPNRPGDRHICAAPWLADELMAHGIVARPFIFPLPLQPDLTPCPSHQFTAFTYLPRTREEFYGAKSLLAAATALPHIQFRVCGDPALGDHPGNIRVLPRLTASATQTEIRNAVVVLRLTEHDAMSALVQEALAAGRQVIFTNRLPSAIYVRPNCPADLIRALEDLAAAFQAGADLTNRSGYHFACKYLVDKPGQDLSAYLTEPGSLFASLSNSQAN